MCFSRELTLYIALLIPIRELGGHTKIVAQRLGNRAMSIGGQYTCDIAT